LQNAVNGFSCEWDSAYNRECEERTIIWWSWRRTGGSEINIDIGGDHEKLRGSSLVFEYWDKEWRGRRWYQRIIIKAS
jgi:hypothetical protein